MEIIRNPATGEIQSIVMIRPDDFHCHLRSGNMAKVVLGYTSRVFKRALVMPNLERRPILDAKEIHWYYQHICLISGTHHPGTDFEPLMTIEVRDSTTPEIIAEAHREGAVAGKVYPIGVTTNSSNGLRDFTSPKIADVFKAMSDHNMPLLIHAEIAYPRMLVTKREESFLPTLVALHERFPNLKIVMEHVSTAAGVGIVKSLGKNVAGTITPHHLFLTLNDVLTPGTQPHNMCMPVPKSYEDREALISAATSGDPKFFAGTDSAPHPLGAKECPVGKCGVFCAPVAMQSYAEIFEEHNALEKLEAFCSINGANFYGLPQNQSYITLVRANRGQEIVPLKITNDSEPDLPVIVPFRAGEELTWVIKM